jgi:hypothetical protein
VNLAQLTPANEMPCFAGLSLAWFLAQLRSGSEKLASFVNHAERQRGNCG